HLKNTVNITQTLHTRTVQQTFSHTFHYAETRYLCPCRIEKRPVSRRIGGENDVFDVIHHRAIAFLTLLQSRLGLFAFGDVADESVKGQSFACAYTGKRHSDREKMALPMERLYLDTLPDQLPRLSC